MNMKTMKMKSWKLKLKNDILCFFSLMYVALFIIISKNVGFWIYIFWWIKKMFTCGDISTLSWMKVWHIMIFTMFLLVWWIFLFLDFRYYRFIFWLCAFEFCYIVSQSWIFVTFMRSNSSKNTLPFLFKALGLGKTHLTSCV